MVKKRGLTQLWGLVTLMRPPQWIKNGFVLIPLIFTSKFTEPGAVAQALAAALLFCLASSAAYVVNDMHDRERDRLHPRKSKTRPLASGSVSPRSAAMLLVALYAALLLGCLALPKVGLIIAGYLILNLGYTLVLKHQPVVDIFTIASGFVLRVYAGATALDAPVSAWMFITTLCLALYLAAIKRRQELSHSGTDSREVLQQYSVQLIDRYAEMSATGALLFYSMFVMSTKPQLISTVPLVLFGLFRYWYVVEKLDGGESPTDALLADWQLLAVTVAWVLTCMALLWPTQG